MLWVERGEVESEKGTESPDREGMDSEGPDSEIPPLPRPHHLHSDVQMHWVLLKRRRPRIVDGLRLVVACAVACGLNFFPRR